MSASFYSWYSLPDLLVLAQRGRPLEGEIPVERFERLAGLLRSTAGSVRAKIDFSRGHDELLLLDLQCEAGLELECQRCLEAVDHDVDIQASFAIAESEDSIALLPQGIEPIELNGDRFQPATLIEDELIVSLPLVPRHGKDKP